MQLFKKYQWFAVVLWFCIPLHTHAQLTIQNGVVLTTTGNGIIALQDMDFVNNGTINQMASTGSFVFTGSGNNTISGSSSPIFDQFQIMKSGAAKVSLLQDIHIAGSIGFTSGLIDLNGYNLFLQPAALLNGENENSRIIGSSGGYIEIATPLNAPNAINPGNLGAIISSAQNLGSTVIHRSHISQTNAYGMGSSVLREYNIMPADNTSLNATVRFTYLNAELNGLDGNSLALWQSPNNISWTDIGFTSRDAATHYVEKDGLSNLSKFTLSSTNNALPVLFSSFSVQCANGASILAWKTAQEQNSHSFNVQKTTDGVQWQTIAILPAAGNSNTQKAYSYTDGSSSGKTFYRIAEYDANGLLMYSGLVSSNCEVGNTNITIYPNPVRDMLWIGLNASAASTVKTELSDSKGVLVRMQSDNITRGTNKFSVNMQGLPAGIYEMSLYWNNGTSTKFIKIVKQ